MFVRLALVAIGATLLTTSQLRAQAQTQHLNPMIDLLEQKKPIFGLGFPSAGGGRGGRGGGRGGAAGAAVGGAAGAATGAAGAAGVAGAGAATDAPPPPPPRTPMDRAREVLAFGKADALFTSDMENNFDRGYTTFEAFAAALTEAGSVTRSPSPRLAVPLAPKSPVIHRDTGGYGTAISKQLNVGTSVIVFPHVESAEEVRRGIAAMRFRSKGGTRPDDVGTAPAHWGLTEAQYRERADVWPINPRGELVAWAIIETDVGMANLEEIASVPGLSAIVVGAGTFSGTLRREGREAEFEPAVARIAAVCKAKKISCGYPTNNETQVEARMKEGFNIHILQTWGATSFQAVEAGRRLGGR